MHLDARIADIAADQLGLITLAQLAEVGAKPPLVRARVVRGAFRRVAPRVYAIGGAPSSWRVELLAGILSLRAEAVVSHRSAAALLGFDRSIRARSSSPPSRRLGRAQPRAP